MINATNKKLNKKKQGNGERMAQLAEENKSVKWKE